MTELKTLDDVRAYVEKRIDTLSSHHGAGALQRTLELKSLRDRLAAAGPEPITYEKDGE